MKQYTSFDVLSPHFFCKLGLALYPGSCFIVWLYDLGSIPFLPGPEIKFIHPTDFDEKVGAVYMYNAYA